MGLMIYEGGDGPKPEAAPTAPDATVVGLYPDFRQQGGSVVAQDVVSVDATDEAHSGDVVITGHCASHNNARLQQTVPGGPGAGVSSGCTGGYSRPQSGSSSTVLVNGEGCVRHDTVFEMNCAGPEGPSNTVGKMVYDRGSERFGNHDYTSVDQLDPPVVPTSAEIAAAEAEEMGIGGHLWGGVKGFGRGAWDAVKGAAQLAAGGAQYSTDYVLGGPVDLITGGAYDYEWLPSARRARGTEQAISDTAKAIYDDPGIVWDALTEEVVNLWDQGKYGEAIGYGSSQVLEALVGTKGASKLRFLSKLDDAELDTLVKKGAISADDAAEARRIREVGDGVVIHRKHSTEIFDEADVAPNQVNEGFTFRGDQHSPEELAAADGFHPSNPDANISLDAHMAYERPNGSQWISTSQDQWIAEQYAWRPNAMPLDKAYERIRGMPDGSVIGYNYHLSQPGGVNTLQVPGIMGMENASNMEVAFSRGIPWSSVSGWAPIHVVNGQPVVGDFVPNTLR
jgi:hypothetical protein